MCKLHFCQVSTFLTNEYSLWTAVGAALSVFITGLFLAFPPGTLECPLNRALERNVLNVVFHHERLQKTIII